jgi:hypothetical protein
LLIAHDDESFGADYIHVLWLLTREFVDELWSGIWLVQI